MVDCFDDFVSLWKEQTKDIKIRKEHSHLLFLVVWPSKVEWDFSVEKQCQTTTFMVSGGPTGASSGHDVQFCYRNEVNDLLRTCKHSHAMIVSVGVVFDMVNQVSSLTPVTPITDFYEFANSKELVTGHIIARPGEQAYFCLLYTSDAADE